MSADPDIARAVWSGDTDWLNTHHRCQCCCSDHTYGPACPAYAWGGCRGQFSEIHDPEAWAAHYALFHGMSRAIFFGDDEETGA
jgi:hypothetical protein